MPDRYSFHALTKADLPMLATWLDTPALRQWWGDPAEELALITEDLSNPLMDQQIARFDDQPFGYLQSYPCTIWRAPQFAGRNRHARAVDTFIGIDSLRGRGHGSAMLCRYAERLLQQGAPEVLIDPDPANERACNAYRRAGFVDIDTRPCEDGTPVIVMAFRPTPFSV